MYTQTSPSARELGVNKFRGITVDMLELARNLDTPKDLSFLKKSDLRCPSSSTVLTICKQSKNIIY